MLIQAFKNRVKSCGQRTAIKTKDKSLTYRQLDLDTDIIARQIKYEYSLMGSSGSDITALLFEHGIAMITGSIGALKAGTAYAPFDPGYPKNRLMYMLKDSEARLIATNSLNYSLAAELASASGRDIKILNIDEEQPIEQEGISLEAPQGDSPAYLLYTSGSTGIPKGVVQTHNNILYFADSYINTLGLTENDRLTLFSVFSHDACIIDIYSGLLSGACLYPYNMKEEANIGRLPQWLMEEGITVWHSVPTLFRYFLNALSGEEAFSGLKYAVLGGEAVLQQDVLRHRSLLKHTALINLYGQSEASFNSAQIIRPEEEFKALSLGRAVPGTSLIILNDKNKRASKLRTGEIAVVSSHLALGYWKNEDKTRAAFEEHPDFGRIYRTGDIGRENLKGEIEYEGRKDFQIKVRGYRVELEEIENCLLKHEEIEAAAVLGKRDKNGEMSLYAYAVCRGEWDTSQIKAHAAKELPEYMVPSYFIRLDKMPLTPTNKVDRLALEKIDISTVQAIKIEPSRNETDERLIVIWREILETDNIGINQSFFDLGGHSLKATTLISRIHKEFNIEISLRQIFKEPTIKGLSDYISSNERVIYKQIQRVQAAEYYEASAAQKRIHTLQQLDKYSTSYNMPKSFEIEGLLDIEALERAFAAIIKRHEVFRTSFEYIDGNLVQKIHDNIKFAIDYVDGTAFGDKEELIKNSMEAFVKPFDLSKAPLLRVGLIKLPAGSKDVQKHMLLLDIHHIIADGTSTAVLIQEFADSYEGRELKPLSLQYKDFAAWQNKLFGDSCIRRQEEYWLNTFSDEPPVLNMSTDYTRPAMQSFEGSSISLELDSQLTSEIRRMVKETDSTLYITLLTALNVLLSKYSGQEDIVVGSPIAGRHNTELEGIIGMFANTLAMRNYPKSEKTLRELLSEVKDNSLRAYENQDYQFEELVERLNIPRDLSRNPLFDVMLILQNIDMKQIRLKDLAIKPYITEKTTAKFDITLTAAELDSTISIDIEYSTRLFRRSTIQRLKEHLVIILRAMCGSLETKLKNIELLTEAESHQILTDFNNTQSDYQGNKTIHELFEEQVKNTPDSTAIEFEGESLTYQQLNQKANQLARVLRESGAAPDTIVGLMVERSLEMVIGIMAILKAGGAFLPIDPEYPEDRISYMLLDSGASVLLTQAHLVDKLNILDNTEINPKITIIAFDQQKIREQNTENLENISTSESLLYVIYTSGSTGKPKGVMLNHRVLNNLISFQKKETNLDFNTRVLQFTTISFDVCYQEIFSTLLSGGQLIITTNEVIRAADKLLGFIADNNIEVMFMATSYFKYIVSNNKYLESLSKSLRHIIVAGEQLIITEELRSYLKQNMVYLHNHYGPSEAHVVSTYTISPESDIPMIPPIGKPISNIQLYITDNNFKLCPVGVAGELCIAGDGLARGYLNRPELTAERFVDNPFTENTKLYKTGDLVKWLEDGNIEFLGRIDNQVKIRGHRIELGEIENKLLEHRAVREAVVITREEAGSGKYLCAYLAAHKEKAEGKEITAAELRAHLAQYLPDYMIPSYFIQLDKLPLTPNGKIDRRALPEPDGSITAGTEYEAPSNETEARLIELWKEVLKVQDVGVKHNFFELGGHSLKAAALLSRVQRELGIEVPLREMFKNPTIKAMAAYMSKAGKGIYSEIQPVMHKDFYDTSSAQKRIYALSQLEEDGIMYNMPMVLEIQGELDKRKLQKAFNILIQRHEALRTSFRLQEDKLVQIVNDEAEIIIEELGELTASYQDHELQAKIKGFVRAFDLSKAPLLRVGLIKLADDWKQQHCSEDMKNRRILPNNQHMLIVDVHHIIADGVSLSLLVKEFAAAYEGQSLEALRLQYKDYAQWQNQQLKSDSLRQQEEYWLTALRGASREEEIPVLNIPTDYPRPSVQSFEGAYAELEINRELTDKLKQIAAHTGSTMYMVMLAAFNILLYKYSGQEDIVAGSPIAGRPHGDLQNIIGMFVNTLAMRNHPKGSITVKEFLSSVKENALRAYENQDYQFEELVEKLNISRDLSRNPVFDVMFSMQNMDIEALRLEGLSIKPLRSDNKISKFDLVLTAVETEGAISLTMQYCTRLFKGSTIARMCSHLENILKEIIQNPDKKLKDIELLSEAEKQCILREFNDTKAYYSRNKCLHEVFEEQAEKTPDNTALVLAEDVSGERVLTYRELNEKANQLARALRDKGIGAESVVALITQRSFEMVVGILGILKAGGAYLPIDPEYPEDRIEYILQDSSSILVLAQSHISCKLSESREVILLDDCRLFEGDSSNLSLDCKASSLAYIIYTSGSTGKPKGVMIEHQSALNTLYYLQDKYPVNKESAYLLKTTYTFDVSVAELFGWYMGQGRLVILGAGDEKDPDAITEAIKQHKITHINFVPSMFNVFIRTMSKEQWGHGGQISSLKYVMLAGEAVSTELARELNSLNTSACFENLYGPTEASIYATGCNLKQYNDSVNVPIGKPIANTRIYILDGSGQPYPIGAAGELCISGTGLARGYLNRPELTAEKFVSNPFEADSRMYRTGDLVRWLEDGNIEFLGRIDHQVKIRGYRIELGEIENKLLSFGGIKEAAVIAREDQRGAKYLCGYFVSDTVTDIEELRKHLRGELAEYMLPAHLIQLEEMPMNANGKLDRKRLPIPDKASMEAVEYTAPRNATEEKLCTVFEEVLRVKPIGIKDNFFYLGGDSIKAIQVSARMQRYGLKLQVKDLLRNPEIETLSKYIQEYQVLAEQGRITGEAELTPIQHWFFEGKMKHEHHFNQAVMLYSREGFDAEATRQVFTSLVRHHDILRSIYTYENNEIKQIIRDIDQELFTLNIHDYQNTPDAEASIEAEANALQGSISLSEGPLVKLGLFKSAEGDYLLMVIHHLAVDGVSWRILFEDMAIAYKQLKQGAQIVLPQKTTSYKAWGKALKEYSNSEEIKKELEYWRQIDKTEIEPLRKDYSETDRSRKNNASARLSLTKEETEALLTKVSRAYNTDINDILLTSLGIAISKWNSSSKIAVSLEGHGREAVKGLDITRTVGWFTTIYPVVLDIADTKDIGSHIKAVKESLRRIPRKGIGYGIIKYLSELKEASDIEFKLKPEICFNYLGQFDGDVKTEFFEAARLSPGAAKSEEAEAAFALDISGIVAEGSLSLSIVYSSSQYKAETIDELAGIYKAALVEIINHCIAMKEAQITPSDLGLCRLDIKELEGVLDNLAAKDICSNIRQNIKEIYSLTPMQEGMLFYKIMDDKSTAYCEQTILDIEGYVDKALYEESLNQIIQRYDVLRTIFIYDNLSKPVQAVLKQRKAQVLYEDISILEEEQKQKYLKDYAEADKKKGFDLTKDILIRLTIIKLDKGRSKLIWSFHHIIMDGWCIGIIMSDFMKIYYSLKSNKPIQLAETYSYSSFIGWLEEQDAREAIEYWKGYLHGYEGQAVVPQLIEGGREDKYIAEEYKFAIDEEASSKIREIARDNQVTINTVMQSVWAILLQRYNNTADVVFGAVVSGRPSELAGIESMVGLFINTVPVRVAAMEGDSFSTILKRVQQNAIAAQKYEYSPLAEIQAAANSKNNLINHIMVFENYPVEDEISKLISTSDLGFSVKGVHNSEETNYDFNIAVALGKAMSISLAYNADKYSAGYIRSIGEQIKHVIKQITENPEIAAENIELLTEQQKQQLLTDFNDTYMEYPKNKTIHEIFEEQVRRSPDRIAVVFEDNCLTYRELNHRANMLALRLREAGLKPDELAGILAERSVEMIIAIIAVLKAGGAYLPINSEYPAERVKYILEDSKANILLTQDKFINSTAFGGIILDLRAEKGIAENGKAEESENLPNINTPDNMAYVIYTSGSTGKPKGVSIEHRNVVNLCCWLNKEYDLDTNRNIMQITNISFDVAVEETLGALLNGASIFIPAEEVILNKEKFKAFADKHSINMAQFVPVTLRELILENEIMESLRIVICGGDKLDDALRDAVLQKGYNLYNCYGPTEITVDAITTRCQIGKTTIGKPIGNARAYILNSKNQLQPVGVAGELCIGGAGVARGYLGKAEITEERFIKNPFSADKEDRIYKTGDLARWLPDGTVQFLGRIDNQVKIRGYRIELGEIESKLMRYEAIKHAVVLVKEDSKGSKYLCAYLETDKLSAEEALTISELREYLKNELPEYMIPSYFVQLDKMPLNVNDKIDRKALMNMSASYSMDSDGTTIIGANVEYEAPRNDTEAKLASIWQEILEVKTVGINDDFFELGGHSLKAASLAARIHKSLAVELPLKELFNNPTIKGISEYIRASERSIYSDIKPVQASEIYSEGYFEVSSAQRRMYVLNEIEPDSTFYNITSVLKIEGALDINKLEQAFNKLIQRHEVLRTSFDKIGGDTAQKIHKEVSFKVERYELDNKEKDNSEEINKIIRSFVRAFDLSKAPLLRVGLISFTDSSRDMHKVNVLPEQQHMLLLDVHHIIADGASIEILASEFAAIYSGKELPELRLQYKDYAVWQSNMRRSGAMKRQEEYWLKEFEQQAPVLKLPTDNERPLMQSFEGDIMQFELGETEVYRLRDICRDTNSTMYMLLLACFNILLSKCSMQEDIVIGCPVAGRPNADLESIIGMFVNTLPIRNYPKNEKTFAEFLESVKQKCLQAYQNQEYQLEELITKLKLRRDTSRNPLFDVVFTYQAAANKELRAGDMRVQPYTQEGGTSKFDMTLTAIENSYGITLYLEYSTALFTKGTIESFIGWFREILSKLADNITIPLREIELNNFINIARVEEDDDVDFDF